ncbi:MAG: septation protein SpoVG family protein [Phycisphaerae bacterium]
MEVTHIRMRLVKDRTDRLKAFCTVTFDEEFVIRDIKVVEGPEGYFIAMPSRKLSASCPSCRHKNQLRAQYCEECGKKLKPPRVPRDPAARTRLYRDIAHPITPEFRQKLQDCIIDAYRAECDKLPPPHAEEDDYDFDDDMSTLDAIDTTEAEGDDYGSLVADLKGGANARSRTHSEPNRDANKGPERDRPSNESHRRPRGRRRGRSRQREEPAAPSADAIPGHDAGQAKDSESPANAQSEVADLVSIDEAQTDTGPTGNTSDDTTTPFGAGIA